MTSALPPDTVRYHGWLESLSPEDRQSVLSRMTRTELDEGYILHRIGDPPDGLYGIVGGAVSYHVAPTERGPQLIHTFTAGTWTGEAELFDGRPRIGTARTLCPTTCLQLSLTSIGELAESGVPIWQAIGVLLASHLELSLCALEDLTIRPPDQRVAAILLRMAGARLADIPDNPVPRLQVTHTDIAALGNMSRTTVSRKLGDFESRGLIRTAYGAITLTDCAGLRATLQDTDR